MELSPHSSWVIWGQSHSQKLPQAYMQIWGVWSVTLHATRRSTVSDIPYAHTPQGYAEGMPRYQECRLQGCMEVNYFDSPLPLLTDRGQDHRNLLPAGGAHFLTLLTTVSVSRPIINGSQLLCWERVTSSKIKVSYDPDLREYQQWWRSLMVADKILPVLLAWRVLLVRRGFLVAECHPRLNHPRSTPSTSKLDWGTQWQRALGRSPKKGKLSEVIPRSTFPPSLTPTLGSNS